MTTLEDRRDAATADAHPLDMTTAAEVDRVRETLAEAGMLGDTVRFAFFAPEEPPKGEVLAHADGDAVDRRFRAVLLDLATGRSWDTVVSADARRGRAPPRAGPAPRRPAADHRRRVRDDRGRPQRRRRSGWRRWRRAASTRRRCGPCRCRPACTTTPRRSGRRIVRAFGFRQDHERDHPWAHPIDGLVAYVDLTDRRGRRRSSTRPSCRCPATPGNFDDPAFVGPAPHHAEADRDHPARGAARSPSRATGCAGRTGTCAIGFNEREGLTLHQIGFDGRPIVYRASIAEMVVPYADPSPVRFWQNYFDCGEYMFARYANSLQLGCDCLGEIHYFDAVHRRRRRAARGRSRNAICMHEEDYGVALEAHRPVHRLARDPPAAPAGDLLLHPDRQLRLRLLLVPLPRRHHRAARSRPTGIVFTVGLPRGRQATTPPRSRPGSARRTTSTCSPRGWT